MKGTIAFFMALFAVLAAGAGGARTLEEVLKEKGVITEADFREVTQSKPVDYRIGKGFTFTAPDGRFQLSLSGRAQLRYTFTDYDNTADVSEWRIRKMKVSLGGYAYTPDLTYRFQAAFENGGDSKILDEAYVGYRFADAVNLQAGQFKMPFARQEITSDGALQFVDRANAVDAFKPSYDIGAMLHGQVAKGLFAYNLGVFGGAGQSQLRRTNSNALVARVAVNPLGPMAYSEADLENGAKPLVSIGANWFMNTLKKAGSKTALDITVPPYASSTGWLGKGAGVFDNTEKVDVTTWGVDAAFKWRGLSVQSEYFAGKAEGGTTARTLDAVGFYAQAGYFLLPKRLEAAARYSYVDPNRDAANDLQTEVQGAVSYYFYAHSLKLQGDWTTIHKQVAAGAATDDRQVRVQAQVVF